MKKTVMGKNALSLGYLFMLGGALTLFQEELLIGLGLFTAGFAMFIIGELISGGEGF